jgi:hypothetical protein
VLCACWPVTGVLNGLIRRIHKFPVIARDLHIVKPTEKGRRPGLDRLLDGRHSYDAICVKLGMSYAELDAVIRLDDSAIAISK